MENNTIPTLKQKSTDIKKIILQKVWQWYKKENDGE